MKVLRLFAFLLCASANAQVVESQFLYVCTNPCMVYMSGAPRPVLEAKFGQIINASVDQPRKYIYWRTRQGTYYAEYRNFMLKSDLDAVYDRIVYLQSELAATKQNSHEARMRSAQEAPKTVTGTLTSEYGYTYGYSETIVSDGHREARTQAKQLDKSASAIEASLGNLKKRWSKLLTAAGYSVIW